MLIIRPAVPEDVPAVADMLEQVIDHLLCSGKNYPNWHHGKYPTPAVPAAALARGDLYVAQQDGKIVGTVTINALQAPQYAEMPWRIAAPPEKVRVIHTLATMPAARGAGLSEDFSPMPRNWQFGRGPLSCGLILSIKMHRPATFMKT